MEPSEITFFDNNNSPYDIIDMKVFYKDNYSNVVYMWNDIIDYIKKRECSCDVSSFDDHICVKLLKEKHNTLETKSETVSCSSYEIGDDYC